MRGSNETGVGSQFLILTQRNFELFFNGGIKIFSTLGFPVLIGCVIIFVCGDGFFDTYESCKSGLFTMMSAAIYVGMFNSLTSICSERQIIKHEYTTNMKLSAYVLALVFVQMIICLAQSAIFTVLYTCCLNLPKETLLLPSVPLELWMTLFMVMLASDMMGITISSVVKTNEMANLVAPIVIIVQIVFSGALFKIENKAGIIANFTVSKWGMAALGSIARLNDLKLRIQETFPQVPHEAEDAYTATAAHLGQCWAILAFFVIVLAVFCMIWLRRVEQDER